MLILQCPHWRTQQHSRGKTPNDACLLPHAKEAEGLGGNRTTGTEREEMDPPWQGQECQGTESCLFVHTMRVRSFQSLHYKGQKIRVVRNGSFFGNCITSHLCSSRLLRSCCLSLARSSSFHRTYLMERVVRKGKSLVNVKFCTQLVDPSCGTKPRTCSSELREAQQFTNTKKHPGITWD